MPDRLLLHRRLKRATRTLFFLALLGAFFIALALLGQSGMLCDPADIDYCIGERK
jgi:hypothetical protein